MKKQPTIERRYFLGRQPILDRGQNIMGFELLFRLSDCLTANVTDYLHASASVIVDAMTGFGFDEVLGRHKGFINVNYDILMSESLELLPKDRVIIELLEMIEPTPEVVNRCRELNLNGFSLALDDHCYSKEYESLYAIVDIIKVDILQTPAPQLQEVVKELRRWPVQLLAEKVETADQYAMCTELGFDLFQGYYFAHPVVLKKNRIDISKLTLMKLLDQILLGADLREIEETFKENPSLTYNLLRLVNSVAIGLKEKIKTLRHAIMVLGQQQLKRWILLALFAYRETPGLVTPLLEMAAMRGRLMELLIRKNPALVKSGEAAESAFMVGILSLIDVLFGVAMEDIVTQLNLSDEARQALLTRGGELGSLLLIVERIEKMDFQDLEPTMKRLGLDVDSLLDAQIQAISWTSKLNQSL